SPRTRRSARSSNAAACGLAAGTACRQPASGAQIFSMDPDSLPLTHSLLELETRVQALEQRVAALQDTRQIEERITQRVAAQVPRVSVASVVDALAGQPLP